MISKKAVAVLLALVFVGMSSFAAAGGVSYYGPVCHEPHAACVPKRMTYGYTPTTWRRWPTDGVAIAPKPAAEQLPTPAAQPSQGAPGSGPTIAPDEAPLMPTDESPLVPTDRGPGAPVLQEEPPLVPPFDEPPAPPSSSAPDVKPPASEPAETAPPTALPDPPEFPTHDSDPPPIKPDDDPFRDDPPSPTDTPAKVPASGGAMGSGNPDAMVRQTGNRSHAAELAREGASAGPRLMPANSLEEPRRLRSSDDGTSEAQRAVPLGTPQRRNPLRSAAQTSGDGKIVPTAYWTKDQSSSSAAAVPPRRNPLRTN